MLLCTFCTFWNPHSFLFLKTKSLKSFSFIFLLSYLSFLAFDVVSCSWGKPLSSFSFSFFFFFSFFSPTSSFFFFCDEENKRRERIRKKRVFSSSEFLQIHEVWVHPRGFQHLRARARKSPVNARAWRGREGGDVRRSRAKLFFV